MPTYNFKEQFVPFVKNFSKRQTVRAYRKDGRLPIPGEMIHLFTGMRTRYCQRLLPKGDKVHIVGTIFIYDNGNVYIGEVLKKEIAEEYLKSEEKLRHHTSPFFYEINSFKNQFAWNDGFRPEGSTPEHPGEAFALMLDFWKNTHSLPFCGTVTYW